MSQEGQGKRLSSAGSNSKGNSLTATDSYSDNKHFNQSHSDSKPFSQLDPKQRNQSDNKHGNQIEAKKPGRTGSHKESLHPAISHIAQGQGHKQKESSSLSAADGSSGGGGDLLSVEEDFRRLLAGSPIPRSIEDEHDREHYVDSDSELPAITVEQCDATALKTSAKAVTNKPKSATKSSARK